MDCRLIWKGEGGGDGIRNRRGAIEGGRKGKGTRRERRDGDDRWKIRHCCKCSLERVLSSVYELWCAKESRIISLSLVICLKQATLIAVIFFFCNNCEVFWRAANDRSYC